MRKVPYIALLLAIVACHNTKPENINEERIAFLEEKIEKADTSSPVPAISSDINLSKLLNGWNNNYNLRFVYLANSSCSLCLGQMFDFITHILYEKNNIPIYVIVHSGDKEVINYYMNNFKIESNGLVSVINNNNDEFVKNLDANNSWVFLCYKNRVIDTFSYSELLYK